MIRFIFILIVSLLPMAASAESCPRNLQALGTERVMEVSAKTTPRVGRKHFPSTLPLNAKELVLTFDDGPWPGTTSKVLDALKAECVRATFFLLGRNAAAHPQQAGELIFRRHRLVGWESVLGDPLTERVDRPPSEPVRERVGELDRNSEGDVHTLNGPLFTYDLEGCTLGTACRTRESVGKAVAST